MAVRTAFAVDLRDGDVTEHYGPIREVMFNSRQVFVVFETGDRHVYGLFSQVSLLIKSAI